MESEFDVNPSANPESVLENQSKDITATEDLKVQIPRIQKPIPIVKKLDLQLNSSDSQKL